MNSLPKNILVVGLGKSGQSASLFLVSLGRQVTAVDDREKTSFGEELISLQNISVKMQFGKDKNIDVKNFDVVIISPGIPLTHPIIVAAKKLNIPVIGELELASRHFAGKIIAITGTNGKTTTTTLLGEMLQKAKTPVCVGGNIGIPMIDLITKATEGFTAVIETSSFQLDTIDTFHANVAILLNITDDHQDRYSNFEAYTGSKGKIFNRQTQKDIAIYNADDAHVYRVAMKSDARKWPFTWKKENLSANQEGALLTKDAIMVQTQKTGLIQFPATKIQLKGSHNMENVAAAILGALSQNVSTDDILKTLHSFKGLPHRMTFVGTIDGVQFYDDSKATNTDAVKRALSCFDKPVILILGGKDKDSDFAVLIPEIQNHVKELILTGEAATIIQKVIKGVVPTRILPLFEDAVKTAFSTAEKGDVVLLSPACASFDAFTSYAHRGDVFQQIVKTLKRP